MQSRAKMPANAIQSYSPHKYGPCRHGICMTDASVAKA